GDNQERIAGAQRFRSTGDRRHCLSAVGAVDGHEAPDVEYRAHDREPVELRLVKDVEAAVQRLEEDRRVDIALVIRTEDDRFVGDILATDDAIPDAGNGQG